MVIVGELVDDRPLRVLGAGSLDFETALSSIRLRGHPQSLAFPAELFECDSRVRDWVLHVLDHGLSQVALWGGHCPPELSDYGGFAHYRLTTAAQAFKAQALAAAGFADAAVGHTENFHTCATRRRLVAPDLVPACAEEISAELELKDCRIIELTTAGAAG
ncbi:hypothetical protein MMAN_21170 [Mycobacterium mantenii]|uniref:Uncharacterized protein n=1 Tax=Mycobacterium mantenii TaxID=560555 RepID=A0ABN6A4F5_MYCNT|nr:hypothetical protein MMAN_21170 [Mycobacterium mantenii]